MWWCRPRPCRKSGGNHVGSGQLLRETLGLAKGRVLKWGKAGNGGMEKDEHGSKSSLGDYSAGGREGRKRPGVDSRRSEEKLVRQGGSE